MADIIDLARVRATRATRTAPDPAALFFTRETALGYALMFVFGLGLGRVAAWVIEGIAWAAHLPPAGF